jgi:hypothetical protein
VDSLRRAANLSDDGGEEFVDEGQGAVAEAEEDYFD